MEIVIWWMGCWTVRKTLVDVNKVGTVMNESAIRAWDDAQGDKGICLSSIH